MSCSTKCTAKGRIFRELSWSRDDGARDSLRRVRLYPSTHCFHLRAVKTRAVAARTRGYRQYVPLVPVPCIRHSKLHVGCSLNRGRAIVRMDARPKVEEPKNQSYKPERTRSRNSWRYSSPAECRISKVAVDAAGLVQWHSGADHNPAFS